MNYLLIIILSIFLMYLILEKYRNEKNLKKLSYVIHVNGIRGKSTVTRLIHAGLSSSEYKVFAKTTGTIPMVINTSNEEIEIKRKGRANIKEQIQIISDAIEEDADVLVVECMAVNPNLQKVSEESILKSNIGVITNVRLDHTEEMGYSLEEIAESLSNTIPKNGYLITSEDKFYEKLSDIANKNNTKTIKPEIKEKYEDINFVENVACAVEVCKLLGVDEKQALENMKNFKRDPYDLRIYEFPNGGIFINGLSINDPQSSYLVLNKILEKYNWNNRKLTLLINNRPDRGYRANHMISLTNLINPDKVLISGAFSYILKSRLKSFDPIIMKNIEDIDFNNLNENDIIYGVGNIANGGEYIIKKAMKEGREYV